MIKKTWLTILTVIISAIPFFSSAASGITCGSNMVNPVSDMCWSCFFPIRIGSTTIFDTGLPDSQTEGAVVGSCPAPPPVFWRYGVNVSYWEPYTLADVVKEPWCMESMGFSIKAPNAMTLGGDDSYSGESPQHGKGATYNVHWYKYPIFAILDIVESIACAQDSGGLDVAYMTEIDPTWLDEDSAAVMYPEALLFNNPVGALACAPDALVTLLGTSTAIDPLFWCIGSQGLSYPFVGKTSTRQSPIQNAVEIMEKFNYKLHRQGFVNETHSGNPANCMAAPDVYLPKSRYRYQMTRPTPSPDWCYPYGTTAQRWESGRANAYTSRDNFGFINFRKHSCLLF
ncbi:conjugal transfer pilus assembly protein TraU [Vibrio furnissii]|uniref:conjugal transfer pilus assembly protein TraU n=1 Tax=Vibrio furnissii TaxID=29494 RepID=UPI001C9CFD54|nr:conjugal transfer pilus assembly protein TraU [Vibrio fluvialis]MCG6230266.1 conjugal transfer pilus assembly protein TraU [Vibrio furnissii]